MTWKSLKIGMLRTLKMALNIFEQLHVPFLYRSSHAFEIWMYQLIFHTCLFKINVKYILLRLHFSSLHLILWPNSCSFMVVKKCRFPSKAVRVSSENMFFLTFLQDIFKVDLETKSYATPNHQGLAPINDLIFIVVEQ